MIDELFQNNENLIVGTFGDVFDSIHRDFLLLCDDTDIKDEKQKVAEDILREQAQEEPGRGQRNGRRWQCHSCAGGEVQELLQQPD
jgi:hypothetical protein